MTEGDRHSSSVTEYRAARWLGRLCTAQCEGTLFTQTVRDSTEGVPGNTEGQIIGEMSYSEANNYEVVFF